MAAAAEKPFMMLSVYFTTTDVYRPPTLAKTGGANSKVGYHMEEAFQAGNTLWLMTLTYYKAHPGGVPEEEAFLQDLVTIIHVNANQGDHDPREVHLDVSDPQRCVWAL